eukprot:1296726-Prymnesium_polylepis.1
MRRPVTTVSAPGFATPPRDTYSSIAVKTRATLFQTLEGEPTRHFLAYRRRQRAEPVRGTCRDEKS